MVVLPKSFILNGFSIINRPFWGTHMYGYPHKPPIIYNISTINCGLCVYKYIHHNIYIYTYVYVIITYISVNWGLWFYKYIHHYIYIYNKHIYKLGLMGTTIYIYITYISINYNYPFNAMDLSKATRTGPSAPSAAFPSLHGIESDMQREPCRNGIPQQVSGQ